jgi:hypothetical protein
MNPNEPLPPDTPKSGIGRGWTILLCLVAPFALVIFLYMVAGGLFLIMLLWSAITCPHCKTAMP